MQSVDEILAYAAKLREYCKATRLISAFLIYITIVAVFSTFMIIRIVPKYGQTNPMVYLSICSLVGSVSVMAIKGFGIALKLTLSGQNQLTHISTYVLGAVVVGCILVQMVNLQHPL